MELFDASALKGTLRGAVLAISTMAVGFRNRVL